MLLLCWTWSSDSFSTTLCSHEELDEVHEEFEVCIKSNLDETDFCSSFSVVDLCFPQEYGKCFPRADIDTMAFVQKATMRKALEGLFSEEQSLVGGFDSGSLFDTCTDIPTHEQAKETDMKLMIWLDHVTTDQGCSLGEIGQAHQQSTRCMKDQRRLIEKKLQVIFLKRVNLQNKVCRALSETVGTCLKKPLPRCFTARESNYIKSSVAEEFKEVFTAMEELLGPSFQISPAECEVWEDKDDLYLDPSLGPPLLTQQDQRGSVSGSPGSIWEVYSHLMGCGLVFVLIILM